MLDFEVDRPTRTLPLLLHIDADNSTYFATRGQQGGRENTSDADSSTYFATRGQQGGQGEHIRRRKQHLINPFLACYAHGDMGVEMLEEEGC